MLALQLRRPARTFATAVFSKHFVTPGEIRLWIDLSAGVIGASNDVVVSAALELVAVVLLDFSGGESC